MYLYAPPSWKLVRQIVLDALVIGWCWGWWAISQASDEYVRRLAGRARAAEESTRQIHTSVTEAADAVGAIPFGGALRGPLDALARAIDPLVANSSGLAAQLDSLAGDLGLWGLVIPVLLVVPFWIWHRVCFWRDSAAVAVLIRAGADDAVLALRALATQPVRRLAPIAADPAAAWRTGDPDVIGRLAHLERRTHGWPRPARKAA